jgi:hypothetical protein
MLVGFGFSGFLTGDYYSHGCYFLPKLLALTVIVAFVQEFHVFLQYLVVTFLLQYVSYPTFELLPLL